MRYLPFRHIGSILWKKRPIQLTFFLTRQCNARCNFCFYLSRDADSASPELTLQEIEKISSSLGTLIWLALSGGEIFLRNDLVEIIELFYKQNRPAIILLPTNGLLPEVIREKTEAILRRCKKSTIVVKLSIDGLENLHDSLRGVRGAFQKTIATYEKLQDLIKRYQNFEIGVNSVFCSANQDHMDNLIAFIQGLDYIRTHTISLIRGEVPDPKLKMIDIQKYHEAITKLEGNLKSNMSQTYRFLGSRLKAAQDIHQRRLIYQTLVEKKRQIPCYAGRLNIVLTETGDLFPCESFEGKMGNVREWEYDINRLLGSEKALKRVQAIKDACCFCTHECYLMTNILFNPLQHPVLIGNYIRLLFSLGAHSCETNPALPRAKRGFSDL